MDGQDGWMGRMDRMVRLDGLDGRIGWIDRMDRIDGSYGLGVTDDQDEWIGWMDRLAPEGLRNASAAVLLPHRRHVSTGAGSTVPKGCPGEPVGR